ncbi:MAG: hypothetical protein Q8N21_01940 [bacterium]|nr:hypothetical protein [bacterium]
MKNYLILSILLLLITGCSISKTSDFTLNDKINNQSTSTNNVSENKELTSASTLSYTDVINEEPLLNKNEIGGSTKNPYAGEIIQWQAKIASSLTQRDGIKFCIIDDEHQNVDSNGNCDWFWLLDKNLGTKDGPNFFNSADWFDYIFKNYSDINPQKIDWGKDTFLITGVLEDIDLDVADRPVPNIEVIKIEKK